MGRVSTCQKNCNTIDLRGAQVNKQLPERMLIYCQLHLQEEQTTPTTKLLTHWGRVTHICVGNLTISGSDNGLSPGRRQSITWTNVGILLTGPLGTNFSQMLIEIHTFSVKKIHLKMSSGKWRPFCLGLNVLKKTPIWKCLMWSMGHFALACWYSYVRCK